ncbi:hypothetical protein WP50_05520, partial [Lactiplantibacillus plantarum]
MVTVPRSGRSVADHLRSGRDWSLNTIRGGLFLSPYNDLKLVAPEKKAALLHHYYDNSIQFLKCSQSEYSVVMSTRNVGNIDLKALLRYHEERNSPVTAVYKRVDPASLIPGWVSRNDGGGTTMRREQVSAIINLLEPSDALQPLTAVRPVGMLPFGGRYRLVDFQLSSVINAGIQNVMVTVPR